MIILPLTDYFGSLRRLISFVHRITWTGDAHKKKKVVCLCKCGSELWVSCECDVMMLGHWCWISGVHWSSLRKTADASVRRLYFNTTAVCSWWQIFVLTCTSVKMTAVGFLWNWTHNLGSASVSNRKSLISSKTSDVRRNISFHL